MKTKTTTKKSVVPMRILVETKISERERETHKKTQQRKQRKEAVFYFIFKKHVQVNQSKWKKEEEIVR